MTHELKTVNPYFESVWDGSKTFEVRLNDRNFQVNDDVILREYDAETNRYSGDEIKVMITHILKDYPALKDGYVVFGFRLLTVYHNPKNKTP